MVRCLRKDPGRRYQHADDLKLALVEVKEESDSGKLGAVSAISVPGRRRSRLLWSLAGTAVLLVAGVAVALWWLRPTSHAIPKTVPLTSYQGRQITPAFSPDGKQVAFAWDGEQGANFDIYVKLVDAGAPLRLTSSPADKDWPAWSPDARYIAFCRESSDHSEIWMIPALGGAERKLGEVAGVNAGMADWCGGLSWSPDGKYMALPASRARNRTRSRMTPPPSA